MALATVRPGVLVSFSTMVHDSGLTRDTDDLPSDDAKGMAPEGATVRVTKTTTIHRDPDEHKRARDLASKVTMMIRRHCSVNPFLWHCNFDDFDPLLTALDAARDLVDAHNADPSNTYTNVKLYFFSAIVGLDVTDEQRARAREAAERSARDMADEVKRLFDQMNNGIDALDPDRIRSAVEQAQAYGSMLSPEQSEAIDGAIENARTAARTIKKLQKKGEESTEILASVTRDGIARARIAFLDLDPIDVTPVSLPAVNVQHVAGLDLDTDEQGASEAPDGPTPGPTPADASTDPEAPAIESPEVDAAPLSLSFGA